MCSSDLARTVWHIRAGNGMRNPGRPPAAKLATAGARRGPGSVDCANLILQVAQVSRPRHGVFEEEDAIVNGNFRTPGYIPALDGLRGIAIIAVILIHSGFPWFQGGFIGVDIFFVLSGFLITYLLVREYDGNGGRISFGRFYARRVLRLAPALILLLAVLWALSVLVLDPGSAYGMRRDIVITLFYAANWARAFDFYMGYLAHAWSLSVEEQFYIAWPVMLLYLLRRGWSRWRTVQLILACACLAALLRLVMAVNGAGVNRLFNGLDTRADSLLIGCALGVALGSGLLDARAKARISRLLRYVPLMALVALLALGYAARWKEIETYYWVLVVVELLTASMILYVFVERGSLAERVLANPALAWVGAVSYEIGRAHV